MYEKRVKGGLKRKHTLGTWPQPVSLAEARAQALILEAEAAQGLDRVAMAEARRSAEDAERTTRLSVGQTIEAYDRLHLSGLRTQAERLRQLKQCLGPWLELPISSLTKTHLQSVVDAKAGEGRKAYANRLRAALMAFSRWAWGRGYLIENIGAGIPRATRETARDRVLSIEEVREIWNATSLMGGLWGPFLRLYILTCQRRGEIAGLTWKDVDFEKRRLSLPGTRTKNSKPHITHLSEPAFVELIKLRGLAQGEGLIFTTTGRTPVSGIGKVKARLDCLLREDFEPWRLHDVRTAFATAMAESGIPENVADRVLNHSASGSAPSAVARVYNRAEQLPQRAAALDQWGHLVTGGVGKVVRMAV